MTTPEAEGTWGAPAPQRPRTPWSTKRIVISAAIAVVIVGSGTAAVMAATNGSSATGSQGGGPGGGFGGGAGGAGGGRFGGGGLGVANALHGDFVVANGSNGYTTERLQTGTVTAISANDVTVKSKDGYTQSYILDTSTSVDRGSDTISKVVKGNTVTVVATLAGQQATATTIEDSTIDARTGQATSGQGGAPGGGASGGPPNNAPGGSQ
jgi:hypothetical protein